MENERSNELRLRVSDAEREAVVARLGEACGEGRITLEEFSERIDRVYTVATRGDLELLTVDLPASGLSVAPVPALSTRGSRRRRRRMAVLSGFELKGRWRVEPENTVVCVLGGATLDLRRAELAAPQVLIRIVSVFGGARVIVPEGVHVDVDGVNVLGGYAVEPPENPPPPGAPTIVIRTVNVFGGASVEFD